MELDLTAAIKAASRAVAEKRQGQHVDPPSARTVGYAEAAVRAAAPLIERAVLERAARLVENQQVRIKAIGPHPGTVGERVFVLDELAAMVRALAGVYGEAL